MHQTNIPRCTILQQKCAHVCTFLLQGRALWDICLMHCGICEMGLLGYQFPCVLVFEGLWIQVIQRPNQVGCGMRATFTVKPWFPCHDVIMVYAMVDMMIYNAFRWYDSKNSAVTPIWQPRVKHSKRRTRNVPIHTYVKWIISLSRTNKFCSELESSCLWAHIISPKKPFTKDFSFSLSKFGGSIFCSLNGTPLIAIKFCTRHDTYFVTASAKNWKHPVSRHWIRADRYFRRLYF